MSASTIIKLIFNVEYFVQYSKTYMKGKCTRGMTKLLYLFDNTL